MTSHLESQPDPGSFQAIDLDARIHGLAGLDPGQLRAEWRRLYRSQPPRRINRDLLIRAIAFKLQERAHGGLTSAIRRKLKAFAERMASQNRTGLDPGISLKVGARLVREWHGGSHVVTALDDGFDYEGRRYRSLTQIAREITGVHWSGPRFFGLKRAAPPFASSEGSNHE